MIERERCSRPPGRLIERLRMAGNASGNVAKLIILLFFVTNWVASCGACGVTQHNVIAEKALEWGCAGSDGGVDSQFFAMIAQHRDAFQNGAAFPDWG